MIGLGTILNTFAIAFGGVCGALFGRRLTRRMQETLNMACGVSVLFIGLAGAMKYMLKLGDTTLTNGGTMLLTLSLPIGGLIGELLDLESLFDRFGEWLKAKTGNANDAGFVNGFVTASLTVCIGAMAIVGSVQDGLTGDYSTLAAKSVLDFVVIMVMTCSLGKGCGFSAIPVFIMQGAMTLAASLLKPFLTAAVLDNLSLVGSALVFCVGINLVWGKKVRVANLLPAIVLAVAAAFLPIQF
ncbi:MAG: DUF554 domain-containing protein [Christensenellales bacterium]